MTDQKISSKYVLASLAAVGFTWLVHEFAHWATSELLGYETIMRLNSVAPVQGQQLAQGHKIWIAAAGPIITLVQALIVYGVLTKKWRKYLYPFLFVPFYMRLLAGLMNVINPNDEGRISAFLGLGLYTLPLLISGTLFFLVYKISKKYRLQGKFHLWTILVVLIAAAILILADQFFNIRIR